jgi:hypothetical protein
MKGCENLLDERQENCADLMAKNVPKLRIAKELNIARSTIYEWQKLEVFQAEVDRRKQEYLDQTKRMIAAAVLGALNTVAELSTTARSDSVRLAASIDLLDRSLGKAASRVAVSEVLDTRKTALGTDDLLDNADDNDEQ